MLTIPRSKKDIGLFNISSNVVNNHISNTVAKLVTLNIKINEVNIKSFTQNNKYICLPENFNTNISHQFFDYIMTFMNSQHQNKNSKGDFVLNDPFEKFVIKISGI